MIKMDFDYANDKIQLLVDNKEIGLNKFTSSFMRDTLWGMIAALDTKDYNINDFKIATIEILKIDPQHMNRAEIALKINNTSIGINEFVSGIMKESIYGMVKSLNTEKFGIEKIDSIVIKIEK